MSYKDDAKRKLAQVVYAKIRYKNQEMMSVHKQLVNKEMSIG